MAETPIDRGRKWTYRLLIVAITLALVVLFIAENFVVVELRLVTGQVEMRLAWAVLIAGGLGVVIGLLLSRLWRRSEP